ncbi:MAG TPA: hypothetical protein VJN92_18590 [Candidatus Acidoferrum sp.]|nr:hypothetical protein [Candidatus Acidoferrum sp.]
MKESRFMGMLAGSLALAMAFSAAPAVAAVSGDVTLTVTAVAKKNATAPAVVRDDVHLFVNKEHTQIANWRRSETLYLAVLIDDSLDPNVAAQWNDLKDFFNRQPSTTYISVSYARNGAAMLAQDFTNNHKLAAKALRIPVAGGAFSSPYLALQDLMKRFPGAPTDRRSILVVTSGIDYLRGNFPSSTDLDSTTERAQKQNINIWAIYSPDRGRRSRGFFLANRAQSDLTRLSDDSGGRAYYLGTSAPVTFGPYLQEISTHLRNQYLLSFRGSGGPKGRFEHEKIATELPRLGFLAPSQVFLPAQK